MTLCFWFLFLEYAFSEDTFVVGAGSNPFLFRSDSRNTITNTPASRCAAVALLFARDRDKPLGKYFGLVRKSSNKNLGNNINRTVSPIVKLVSSVLLSVLFLVELTDFQYHYCLCLLILQILVKLNSMLCYQLAYHQSVQRTGQLLLNVGKVLLGSLHLEKQFVGILMAKLF